MDGGLQLYNVKNISNGETSSVNHYVDIKGESQSSSISFYPYIYNLYGLTCMRHEQKDLRLFLPFLSSITAAGITISPTTGITAVIRIVVIHITAIPSPRVITTRSCMKDRMW